MTSDEASNLFGQISAEKIDGEYVFAVGISAERVAHKGNGAIDYRVLIGLGPKGTIFSWHDLFDKLRKGSRYPVRLTDNGIILS